MVEFMSNPVATKSTRPKAIDIRELVREEYKKCAADPAYFMRKYCYIQHRTRGRMLFDLYPFQEQAIRELMIFDSNIILKARQIGISTVVACFSLWMALFQRDKNILVIATKQDTAKNLIDKAQFAYEHLPVWLKSPYKENNKLNLKFKNGSQIKAVSQVLRHVRLADVEGLLEVAHAFDALRQVFQYLDANRMGDGF